MAGATDRELVELLKSNLWDEKERNLEYINTLKDFIQHLKHGIQRKNDLLNILYINSMDVSKDNIEVETRLHSTLANETQLSDTPGYIQRWLMKLNYLIYQVTFNVG